MVKELVAKMKRLSLFGLALMAALGLSVLMASSASATGPAPYWSIGGTRLGANQTHNITARSYKEGTFVLSATGSTTTCTALKLKEGVLLGSAEGEPGLNNEVLVFTGCSAIEGTASCEVKNEGGTNGTIETHSLKSELVEDETGKKLLLLLQSANGSGEFVTLVYTGTGCTPESALVNGSYVLRVATEVGKQDPELGETTRKQETSWLLETQTQPAKVTKYKAGVGTVTATKAFQFAGKPATQSGIALVLLASRLGVTEEVYWSPLP
jgi:hypothetical protein